MSKDLDIKITTTYETKGKSEITQQSDAIKKVGSESDKTGTAASKLTKEHAKQVEMAQKLTMAAHGSAEGIAGLAKEFVRGEAASAKLSAGIGKLGLVAAALGVGVSIGNFLRTNVIDPFREIAERGLDLNSTINTMSLVAKKPAQTLGEGIGKAREAARSLAAVNLEAFTKQLEAAAAASQKIAAQIAATESSLNKQIDANSELKAAQIAAMPEGQEKDSAINLHQKQTDTQRLQVELNAAKQRVELANKNEQTLREAIKQKEDELAEVEKEAEESQKDVSHYKSLPESFQNTDVAKNIYSRHAGIATRTGVLRDQLAALRPKLQDQLEEVQLSRTDADTTTALAPTRQAAINQRYINSETETKSKYDAQEAARKQQEADAAARAKEQADAQQQRQAEAHARAREQADRAAELKRDQAEKLKNRIDIASEENMKETLEARGAYERVKKNPRDRNAVRDYEREKKEAEEANTKFAKLINELTLGNKETLDLMTERLQEASNQLKKTQDIIRRIPL